MKMSRKAFNSEGEKKKKTERLPERNRSTTQGPHGDEEDKIRSSNSRSEKPSEGQNPRFLNPDSTHFGNHIF